MKCKYEHDGDCCNMGAEQYMCKCKQLCGCIAPLTNADRIRGMSDDELHVFLCGIAATNGCGGCLVQEYCYADHNGFADWLKKPWEGV